VTRYCVINEHGVRQIQVRHDALELFQGPFFPKAWVTLLFLAYRGDVPYRETIAQDLANAPEAFMGLLKGKNFGKQLVKLT
jgi:NADPH-dependent curcumin reductase CurA